MLSENLTELNKETDEIKEYFIKICNEDKHELDPEFFFKRVRNSLKNNGLEKTAVIYDLDNSLLSKIEI